MDSTIDSPPRKVRNLSDIYAKPTCFEDIVTREKWLQVMKREIVAIEKNMTWTLVEFPNGKDVIGLK